jgi:hypothetical protein
MANPYLSWKNPLLIILTLILPSINIFSAWSLMSGALRSMILFPFILTIPSCPPPTASILIFLPLNVISPFSHSIIVSPLLHFIIFAGSWITSPDSLTFNPSPKTSQDWPGVYRTAFPVPGPPPSDAPSPVLAWNAKDCASDVSTS